MKLLLLSLLVGQTTYQMDEVVVTASRYPVLLQNIAVAVKVLDRGDIERLQPLGLEDILGDASGIDFKSYGTPGALTSVSIRGVSSNGTLVLVNGHPLNTVTNGMADLSSIDINSIERIEIVKGPVSSIYGANVLGGLVNIITFRELNKREIEMNLTPSTPSLGDPFETSDLSVRLGLPLHATQLNINGAYSGSAGQRSNSDLTKYTIGGSLRHSTERSVVSTSLLYSEKEYGLPGPLPNIDSLNPTPLFGDSTATSVFDRENDRTLLADASAELRIANNLKWYIKVFGDRKQTIYITAYSGMIGDTVSEEYDHLTYAIGMSTMLAVNVDKIDMVLGVDAHYDTLHTRTHSTATGDTSWKAGSYNTGVWTELRAHLTERILLSSSVRYDENSTFGAFLSPGIGIVSMLNEFTWLKFSVGKTFRAPSFNDLYWPQSGNRGLKPEHGWAYEVRVESSPLPALVSAVSLFIREIKDRIAWLPQANGLWQPQNVNSLSVKGMDVELKHDLNEFIRYTLDLTYLDARQCNDEIIYSYYDWVADTGLTITDEIERTAAFTPRYGVSSAIDIKLGVGLGFNVTGQYASERLNYYANYDDYPNVTMDTKALGPYLAINTALSARVFKHAHLTVGVKNVFDTDYSLQFGNTIADLDYPMPGRTYFARFTVQY